MIPAYLINMDRSTDRLAHMEREFRQAGAPFFRWPGVDGEALSEEGLDEFVRQRPLPDAQWRRGEVGCFLSHFGLWRHIAEGPDAAAAIFEDDVFLSSDLGALLASPDWIPRDADLVKLEANRKALLRRGRRIDATPKRRIHRVASEVWYTAGYIVTKQAAAKLAATPPGLHRSTDIFLFFPDVSPVAKELRCYQVSPAACIQCNRLGERGVLFESYVSETGFATPVRAKPLLSSRLFPWKKQPVPFEQ